ncbi:hypothetical protein IMZ48_27195 [Candidatus Bathyarchaeota archaeon]|nr:hypothetical protein [Candidatus Bathyarchaeota archaeon]
MSAFLPARAAARSILGGVRAGGAGAGATRAFSGTAARPSKLGRTPLGIPPGVEVKVSERWVLKDLTSYLQQWRRTVYVAGPLGMSFPSISSFLASIFLLLVLVRGRAGVFVVSRCLGGRSGAG